MYDEIVVEFMDATQKDLFFHGPTIMVQVLYALMEQVKMDHLSGGKCISKRPPSKCIYFPSICGVNNFWIL